MPRTFCTGWPCYELTKSCADWYYLTGRSTSSVYQFKRGFRPEEIELLKPHRLVLRPGLMRGIETVQPIAMQTARKVLGIANRLRGRS